jgi:hypothetical protein
MDWLSSGTTHFRYVLVDRSTMEEVKELDMFIPGGQIEFDDLTSVKVSGSLPFIFLPEIGFDYLRIYSISEDDKHNRAEILHGTFLVSTPSSDIMGRIRTGSASIYSVLQIAYEAVIEQAISIPAGTNAVTYARNLLTGLGLSVIADPSSTTTTTIANYEAGTKKLEIINDLCSIAGFNSANVDGRGNVRLTVYNDPTLREPTIEFVDGNRCNFDPVIPYEFDIWEVPNVVVAVMSNQDTSLSATAKNTNPFSIYSTVRRGREIPHVENVNDIPNITALQQFAERRLAEKSSAVESIVVRHAFRPYNTGDVGRFKYDEADFEFTGAAVKKTIDLIPGMPCSTRFRRFVRG